MKRMLLSAATVLMLAGISFGADPAVTVPAELKTKPGRLLRIKAESPNKVVKWYVYSDDADLIPFESTKEAIFSSPTPGKYRVLVYTAAGDVPSDPVVCIVTVEGVVPPPPTPPEPGPGPTPPTPPVPPTPADPLAQAFQKAYTADTAADKAAKLAVMTTLWRNAATTTVNDPDLKTVGQLLQTLQIAGKQLLDDDLMGVRDAVRAELDGKLPKTAGTVLDAATRQAIGAQFQRIADALGKVK